MIYNKKGEDRFFIRNKNAMQMSISTLILMVLGILILMGMAAILIMGWGDFKTQVKALSGSEMAKAHKNCKLQCNLDNSYDYCCEKKIIDDNEYTCVELLEKDCGCEDICLDEPPIPSLP